MCECRFDLIKTRTNQRSSRCGEKCCPTAPHNDPATAIRKKLAVERDLFFVAENAGAVIGTVMGGYDGHRGWIYSVATDPAHRRQGIGSALLRRMEAALRERGCLKINLQVRLPTRR